MKRKRIWNVIKIQLCVSAVYFGIYLVDDLMCSSFFRNISHTQTCKHVREIIENHVAHTFNMLMWYDMWHPAGTWANRFWGVANAFIVKGCVWELCRDRCTYFPSVSKWCDCVVFGVFCVPFSKIEWNAMKLYSNDWRNSLHETRLSNHIHWIHFWHMLNYRAQLL